MTKAVVGARVRMKVRTMSGWKGTGTITQVHGNSVTLIKDGYGLDEFGGKADALRDQVQVLRE